MKKTNERELRNLYNELELIIRRNFKDISEKFTAVDAIEKHQYYSFTDSTNFSDTSRVYIYFGSDINKKVDVEVEACFSGFNSTDIGKVDNHVASVIRTSTLKQNLDTIIKQIKKIKGQE